MMYSVENEKREVHSFLRTKLQRVRTKAMKAIPVSDVWKAYQKFNPETGLNRFTFGRALTSLRIKKRVTWVRGKHHRCVIGYEFFQE